MKQRRHEVILELISKNVIDTQEELLKQLKERGYNVTQATVSRDIKQLRLIKALDAKGNYCYVGERTQNFETDGKYYDIFSHSVISVEYALNMVVIKCYVGMAQGACAALDKMNWPMVIGTIAGDDTIFVVASSEEAAKLLTEELLNVMEK